MIHIFRHFSVFLTQRCLSEAGGLFKPMLLKYGLKWSAQEYRLKLMLCSRLEFMPLSPTASFLQSTHCTFAYTAQSASEKYSVSILQALPRFTASFRSFHIGKVLLSLAEFRGSKDILWGSFAFFGGNFHDAGTRQKVTLAYSRLPSIHLQPNGSTFHTLNTVGAWFDTPESLVSIICMKRAQALFSKAWELRMLMDPDEF